MEPENALPNGEHASARQAIRPLIALLGSRRTSDSQVCLVRYLRENAVVSQAVQRAALGDAAGVPFRCDRDLAKGRGGRLSAEVDWLVKSPGRGERAIALEDRMQRFCRFFGVIAAVGWQFPANPPIEGIP